MKHLAKSRRWIPLLLFSVSPFVIMVQWSWGHIYQCTDHSGTTVYTDSPAQLRDCRILNGEGPQISHTPGLAQEPHLPNSNFLVPNTQAQKSSVEIAVQDYFAKKTIPTPFESMDPESFLPPSENVPLDNMPMNLPSPDVLFKSFNLSSDPTSQLPDPQ